MTPEIFAEWLRRQGHPIFETPGSHWYMPGARVLQAFPYHGLIHPDQAELEELFRQTKAIALRYSTSLAAPRGKLSYHVVFEGSSFEIDSFSKKVRHDIQRGLEYAEYLPVSFDRMEEEGWRLREETLARQGRQGAENRQFWARLCNSAAGLTGFEAWGALREDRLVAAIFTYIDHDTASILYHQSLSDHLKFGVNNTLVYRFVNSIYDEKKAPRIFYGMHSLDAPASVDEFKFRMGFRALPVRQVVVFNPLLDPVINQLSQSALSLLRKLVPHNTLLAKAEGMLRFCLEGKQPLDEQSWPEILLEQRETLH